jgi:hypothetical protein
MGTLENHHSENDVISIRWDEIRFRPWAPNLRFCALDYDFVRLRLPDGWREEHSSDFSSITPDLQCELARDPISGRIGCDIDPDKLA